MGEMEHPSPHPSPSRAPANRPDLRARGAQDAKYTAELFDVVLPREKWGPIQQLPQDAAYGPADREGKQLTDSYHRHRSPHSSSITSHKGHGSPHTNSIASYHKHRSTHTSSLTSHHGQTSSHQRLPLTWGSMHPQSSLAGEYNLHPRMAINVAQHKILNLLKTL